MSRSSTSGTRAQRAGRGIRLIRNVRARAEFARALRRNQALVTEVERAASWGNTWVVGVAPRCCVAARNPGDSTSRRHCSQGAAVRRARGNSVIDRGWCQATRAQCAKGCSDAVVNVDIRQLEVAPVVVSHDSVDRYLNDDHAVLCHESSARIALLRDGNAALEGEGVTGCSIGICACRSSPGTSHRRVDDIGAAILASCDRGVVVDLATWIEGNRAAIGARNTAARVVAGALQRTGVKGLR